MKKVLLIIVSAMAVIAIAVIGVKTIHPVNTPEDALKEIVEDVNQSGIDGLRPHLTKNAQEIVDTVSAVADNELVSSVMGLLSDNEYVDIFKSGMRWDIRSIQKGKDNAAADIELSYDNAAIATIKLLMIRDGDSWKIDSLELPDLDDINWW